MTNQDEDLIKAIVEKLAAIDHDIGIIESEIYNLGVQSSDRQQTLVELQQLKNTLVETKKTMESLLGVTA